MSEIPKKGNAGDDPTTGDSNDEPAQALVKFRRFVLDWRFVGGGFVILVGWLWNKYFDDTALAPYLVAVGLSWFVFVGIQKLLWNKGWITRCFVALPIITAVILATHLLVLDKEARGKTEGLVKDDSTKWQPPNMPARLDRIEAGFSNLTSAIVTNRPDSAAPTLAVGLTISKWPDTILWLTNNLFSATNNVPHIVIPIKKQFDSADFVAFDKYDMTNDFEFVFRVTNLSSVRTIEALSSDAAIHAEMYSRMDFGWEQLKSPKDQSDAVFFSWWSSRPFPPKRVFPLPTMHFAPGISTNLPSAQYWPVRLGVRAKDVPEITCRFWLFFSFGDPAPGPYLAVRETNSLGKLVRIPN